MSLPLQTGSLGGHSRQDYRGAVRVVMFETGIDGCQYATNGGSAFAQSVPVGTFERQTVREGVVHIFDLAASKKVRNIPIPSDAFGTELNCSARPDASGKEAQAVRGRLSRSRR